MIKAVFETASGKSAKEDQGDRKTGLFEGVYSVKISGHSGLSGEGSDILCAAVSAMSMLAVNTLTEQFRVPLDVKQSVSGRNKAPVLEIRVPASRAFDRETVCVFAGLYEELAALEAEYPRNLKLERKISERKKQCSD